MKISIAQSNIHGTITAPSSKSISHRAIIVAALSHGTSIVSNVLIADDIAHTINALRQFGVKITQKGSSLTIHGSAGKLQKPGATVSLGNSGSSMRFLTAVSGLVNGSTVLTGEKRLCERPIGDLLDALKNMGLSVRSMQEKGYPPVEVIGGRIKGGEIMVNGNISSQFISALLLIAPFADGTVILRAKHIRSKPYIDVTLRVMNDFGVAVTNDEYHTFTTLPGQMYRGQTYTIEGDYSSSSYFFAASAVTGSTVTVKNLKSDTKQGDAFFVTLLQKMGCSIDRKEDEITLRGAENLSAITIDLKDHPDIVQILAVVAAFAKGTTTISNIGHLKHKETNRIEATANELKKMGVIIKHDDTTLEITGGSPKGSVIDTYDDHRMAMSFAIAGLGASGATVISDAEVVNKSYPNFFKDLQLIGAKTKEIV